MASPRFIAAPQVRDYASQILAVYEEGFRRKMAAAERAGDEKYARDTADYANRVAFAQSQLKAAQAELLAARKAVQDLEVKDAQGAASAAKTIAQLNRSRADAAMLADAVRGKGGAPAIPEWVRTDVSDDQIAKDVAGLTRWDQVYPDYTDKDDDPKYADRELIDQALAAVDKAPVNHGVKKVLAVGWLVAHNKIPRTVSMESLKEAAIREAMGTNPANWHGVSAMISDGYEALNPPGEPLQTDVGEMLTAVNNYVDLGSKSGNNPDEAAESLERAKKGTGAKGAKVEALDENLADPDKYRPDYSAAKEAAAQRLAEAEAGLAGIEIPTPEEFLDRISRTRNVYAEAYSANPKRPAARVTPEPDPIDALIEEVRRTPPSAKDLRPVTYEMDAKEKAAVKASNRAILGPKANTEEAKKAMEEADKVIAEPVPSNVVHPAIPLLQEKGLLDFDQTDGELDMSTIEATPLTKHKALLEKEGLIARGGAVRKNRANHLAATTSEGRQARAALDDAGGDLDAALAKLKTDKSKAIAVGLIA